MITVGLSRGGYYGNVTVILLALGAAMLFGIGSVVQQHVAFDAPPGKALRISLLWWLVRQPLWLVGVGTALVGNLASGSALGLGTVTLVQPLLVSRLLFAVPLSAIWARQRLARRDWLGVVATAGGLAAFVAISQPEPGDESVPAMRWIITGVVIAGLTVGLVVLTRRTGPARKAMILGAGAGVLFGLQSGLTHTAVGAFLGTGLLGLLLAWATYAVVVTAVAGTLLAQSAYEMAPLRMAVGSAQSPQGRPVVLFAGRVDVTKGAILVAEAMRTVIGRGQPAHLVVAGEGAGAGHIARLLGADVTQLGHVPQQELARIYASCDMMAFPSSSETAGNVVAEAMASGLPVALPRGARTTQWLVAPGEDGLIVHDDAPDAWARAIGRVLADPERCARMGRRARLSSDAFHPSWSTVFWEDLVPVWRQARWSGESRSSCALPVGASAQAAPTVPPDDARC